MQRLDKIRSDSLAYDEEAFARRLSHPVLVSQHMIRGELRRVAKSRPESGGRTMMHLQGKDDMERIPVTHERYVVLRRRNGANPGSPLVLGRESDCDVVVNDYSISAVHAHLYIVPLLGRVLVSDENSTNGSAHNGTLLEPKKKVMLVDGDYLNFGRMGFVFFRPGAFWRYLNDAFEWPEE